MRDRRVYRNVYLIVLILGAWGVGLLGYRLGASARLVALMAFSWAVLLRLSWGFIWAVSDKIYRTLFGGEA